MRTLPSVLAAAAVLVALAVGCGSNDDRVVTPSGPWVRQSAGSAFSLALPPDMEYVSLSGIDSFGAEFRGPAMVVAFDYGWYSNSLDEAYFDDPIVEQAEIDGWPCRIVQWRDDMYYDGLTYVVGAHFPDVGDGQNRLTIVVYCATAEARQSAKAAFATIEFGAR